MISCQYAAGFVDGEGCINVASLRGRNHIRVLVVNTNLEILEMFKERWGGDISAHKRHKSHWKIAYTWRVQHKTCLDFLNDIYPYIIIKRKQVEAAFMFFDARPGTGKKWTDENLKIANDAIQIIKQLNRKGVDVE